MFATRLLQLFGTFAESLQTLPKSKLSRRNHTDLNGCAAAMQAASAFVQGVSQIEGLEVCGKPDMCVVAIKSTDKGLNIYKVNDLMTQKGWHLNALQFPSSVHMCFTAQHVNVVPELLQVWLLTKLHPKLHPKLHCVMISNMLALSDMHGSNTPHIQCSETANSCY